MPKSFPEAEIEAAAGAAPVERRRVRSSGYGTNSAHWCVNLADGRRAFVKVALDDAAAEWLRQEHRVYSAVEAPFIPELLGWHDGEQTLLAIADLSDAHWPPPWTTAQIDQVLAQLEAMHAVRVDLPALTDVDPHALDGWSQVARDPGPFLSLGLASRAWLETALPALVAAEAACSAEGEALTHYDLRSDNICIASGGAMFIDWAAAARGNPALDLGFWLPSLQREGGPPPASLLPGHPEVAAAVSGYFAARAGLPIVPSAPRVRIIQRAQLETALPWAIRALGLPPPA